MKQSGELATQIQAFEGMQGLTLAQEQEMLRRRMRSGTPFVPTTTGDGGTGGLGVGVGGGVTGTAVNEALRNALRLIDHKKRMDQISIQEEISYLEQVKALHVKNTMS